MATEPQRFLLELGSYICTGLFSFWRVIPVAIVVFVVCHEHQGQQQFDIVKFKFDVPLALTFLFL